MGNMWGTSKRVPHPSIPLYIGIPRDLWGISEIMHFPDFLDQLTQKLMLFPTLATAIPVLY